MSPADALAALAQLLPFLAWAEKALPPADVEVVKNAARRFAVVAAGTLGGFELTDAEIDARLADIEANGK